MDAHDRMFQCEAAAEVWVSVLRSTVILLRQEHQPTQLTSRSFPVSSVYIWIMYKDVFCMFIVFSHPENLHLELTRALVSGSASLKVEFAIEARALPFMSISSDVSALIWHQKTTVTWVFGLPKSSDLKVWCHVMSCFTAARLFVVTWEL